MQAPTASRIHTKANPHMLLKKRRHDSLHKQACPTPLGGGAAVCTSCSIMEHICTLITKAKVVGLAGSTHKALGYDLYLKYRQKYKKPHTLCKRELRRELP